MEITPNVTKPSNPIGRSVKALADSLGISPGLVRLEIARRHLEVVRIGRRVIIRDEAIQRWLEGGTQRSHLAAGTEQR